MDFLQQFISTPERKRKSSIGEGSPIIKKSQSSSTDVQGEFLNKNREELRKKVFVEIDKVLSTLEIFQKRILELDEKIRGSVSGF